MKTQKLHNQLSSIQSDGSETKSGFYIAKIAESELLLPFSTHPLVILKHRRYPQLEIKLLILKKVDERGSRFILWLNGGLYLVSDDPVEIKQRILEI